MSGSINKPRTQSSGGLSGANRFHITVELANTLQGRIYGAVDRLTGKNCVVKEAWKQLVHTNRSRKGGRVPEDFLHERDVLMKFAEMSDLHPGIIRGLDMWEDDQSYYVAMEYCGAELFTFICDSHSCSLIEFVSQESRKPQECAPNETEWLKTVKMVFKQLVEAVAWMHSKGFCHLDLSLENVMFANLSNKKIKIIDLGIAKEFDPKTGFKTRGRVGKLQYMCPEAYRNGEYDARAADVYCLGVMLFMMLVGAPPYAAPQPQNTAFRLCVGGQLRNVLKHWKRLRLVSEDALDLLSRLFRYENERISIVEMLQHPFLQESEEETPITKQLVDLNVNSEVESQNNSNVNNNNSNNNNSNDTNVTNDNGDTNANVNVNNEFHVNMAVERTATDVLDESDNDNDNDYEHEDEHQQQPQQKQQNATSNKHQPYKPSPTENTNSSHDTTNSSNPYAYSDDESQDVVIDNNDNYNKNNDNMIPSDNTKLHSYLLTKWDLSKYINIIFTFGMSDVNRWDELNVAVLKHDYGFDHGDATRFVNCYTIWKRSEPAISIC